MSRLAIPLVHRILWSTGDILLRPELFLAVKTDQGTWEEVSFLVDSGSEITIMAANHAKQLGLPMPLRAASGVLHQPYGLEVRSALLRMKVVGMDSSEHVIPCFFLGDPDAPPFPSTKSPSAPRNLLGLSGVIDKLRITFDGNPGPGAAFGNLIVEEY
jgi:hypothetical protein